MNKRNATIPIAVDVVVGKKFAEDEPAVLKAANAVSDDDFTKEKYRLQNDFMKELGVNGHRIMDARNCRIAGFQSRLFTFYADTAQDGQNHVRTAFINNTQSGKCVSVCLLQNLDSLYDYVEDFNTMIETAAASS